MGSPRSIGFFSSELGVGEPPSGYLRHNQREPIRVCERIILHCPVIEPECLPIHVYVKVERLYANVGAT